MRAINRHDAPLSDDRIVDLACFPLLKRGEVPEEDYAFALAMDTLSRTGANPLAYVTWPTGVKIVLTIRAGDREPARELLIKTYRAAEAGHAGRISLGGGE